VRPFYGTEMTLDDLEQPLRNRLHKKGIFPLLPCRKTCNLVSIAVVIKWRKFFM